MALEAQLRRARRRSGCRPAAPWPTSSELVDGRARARRARGAPRRSRRPTPGAHRAAQGRCRRRPSASSARCRLGFYERGDERRASSGARYIPHNRNTIVVANHASHLDMGFVKHALGHLRRGASSRWPRRTTSSRAAASRRAFFENLTNLDAVRPQGRRCGRRMRQAGEVIERGKTVLIFPEGTRSPTARSTSSSR